MRWYEGGHWQRWVLIKRIGGGSGNESTTVESRRFCKCVSWNKFGERN